MPQDLRFVPVVNDSTSFAAMSSTTTTARMQLPLADAYTIVFDATSVAGTSPTCDIVMQTSWDKGTTYINVPLRSAQISAAGVHWNMMRMGPSYAAAAATQAGVADTGGAVNANFHFDPQYVKFKATVAGTSPVFTVKIHIFCVPRGSSQL